MVPLVVAIHRAIREGALDVDSKDLETLMGRPATPLIAAIGEIIKDMAVPV
jgi:NAD(P)H dehydrogenase (quinone)